MTAGMKGKAETVVTEKNTAKAMGSGTLDVFATPAMVALMEHAAMYAVAADLPEGSTTVGASMETTHVRPSAVGAVIAAEAELVETEGRRLTFRVAAFDGEVLIGEGTHVRYIVDRAKFLSKL